MKSMKQHLLKHRHTTRFFLDSVTNNQDICTIDSFNFKFWEICFTLFTNRIVFLHDRLFFTIHITKIYVRYNTKRQRLFEVTSDSTFTDLFLPLIFSRTTNIIESDF